MKILLTCARGYKGTVLAPKLLAAGNEVIAFDIMWFGNFLKDHRMKQFSYMKGAISNNGCGLKVPSEFALYPCLNSTS